MNIQVIRSPKHVERMVRLLENVIKIDDSGIIYCSTIRDHNKVAVWLRLNNINTLAYHAKLSSDNDIREIFDVGNYTERLLPINLGEVF